MNFSNPHSPGQSPRSVNEETRFRSCNRPSQGRYRLGSHAAGLSSQRGLRPKSFLYTPPSASLPTTFYFFTTCPYWWPRLANLLEGPMTPPCRPAAPRVLPRVRLSQPFVPGTLVLWAALSLSLTVSSGWAPHRAELPWHSSQLYEIGALSAPLHRGQNRPRVGR